MNQDKRVKIFISYCHLDETYVDEFIKHMTPLIDKEVIEIWYDRRIIAGKEFQNNIDNNIENSNIICLFVSANFLASKACKDEKKVAFNLKNKKGIQVVSIILSHCGWKDDSSISSGLAIPTDGTAIDSFTNKSKGWHDVYNYIKNVIDEEIKITKLVFTNKYSDFLQNTGLLTQAHSDKEQVLLDDIFVYPDLDKYNQVREYDKKESSQQLIENILDHTKVLIAGENQSGKTTLCKIIIIELKKLNYIPVFLSDPNNQYKGKIDNLIVKEYNEQYDNVKFEDIDHQRIVPILDDFHFAVNKEKVINDLSNYPHQIITVDDIFSLNIKDESLITSFTHYKIKEFNPSLRNELIKKWTYLTDQNSVELQIDNNRYKNIDQTTELVNTSLGKVIGSGIMPSYPFYILTVISTYTTFGKPLEQKITSQGHCYQALIYMYLRKNGVKNEDVDTYINFLSEFAFFIYKASKNFITKDEFDSFMKQYLTTYNLPLEQKTLLMRLINSKIILLDNFNNYSFNYRYLYYFFVAKHIADKVDDNKEVIDSIIKNLHKDENAYIAIFVSHHSQKDYILDEIILNAYMLFDMYSSASLSKEELSFFDEQVDNIIKLVLPPSTSSPEIERDKRLKVQDKIEEDKSTDESKDDPTEDGTTPDDSPQNFELLLNLRRSIKTVEVMGRIIKNRAGSLERPRLEMIFEEAMNIHLRILTSFFDLIKNDDKQSKIIEFITKRLKIFTDAKKEKRRQEGQKEKEFSSEELEKLAKSIFWNTNFFVASGIIEKTVHSLGSDQLIDITEKVCNKIDSPATFLIKHGILMWYRKQLEVDKIEKKFKEKEFSETAKEILKFLIVEHCSIHKLTAQEKQTVESKLKISSKEMLLKQISNKE